MDMNQGAATFAAAVITCIVGCATKPTYVPPAAGEPQATIRSQHLGGFPCTDANLYTLDDQALPFRSNVWEPMPISPGPHIATIQGRYGAAPVFINFIPFIVCPGYCVATLQFTAEPSHVYQLELVKEGDPYHIDLIDLETNRWVVSAPCPGWYQTGKKPQAPGSGSDEGAKYEFLKR